jgi:putative membrane protein
MKNTLVSLGLFMALGTSTATVAQSRMDNNMVGKMSKTAFDQKNKAGASMVSAITPTSTKLSKADETLMMMVAKGGMMQLETSRIAAQKASNMEVREFAQAEVEEQTGLSNKLKEIASAKGVTLPASPDADLQAMLTKMEGMSGTELDRHYMEQHAIKGHEVLDNTMQTVKSQATDGNLKAVAKAAHPLVKTHLKVAREMQNKMMKNSTAGSR